MEGKRFTIVVRKKRSQSPKQSGQRGSARCGLRIQKIQKISGTNAEKYSQAYNSLGH